MSVGRGLADAVEEVDGDVVLVLGEPHLARKGVQVADEGGHHLPQPSPFVSALGTGPCFERGTEANPRMIMIGRLDLAYPAENWHFIRIH